MMKTILATLLAASFLMAPLAVPASAQHWHGGGGGWHGGGYHHGGGGFHGGGGGWGPGAGLALGLGALGALGAGAYYEQPQYRSYGCYWAADPYGHPYWYCP